MYLIDTSVLIDFLRKKTSPQVQLFEILIDRKSPFGITSLIYQEVLQGAKSEEDFSRLEDYLGTQRFYHPKHPIQSYVSAAFLYYACRKKGETIRSMIDCLIAQVAIEHNLILLHNDNDYNKISKIIPKLKVATKEIEKYSVSA